MSNAGDVFTNNVLQVTNWSGDIRPVLKTLRKRCSSAGTKIYKAVVISSISDKGFARGELSKFPDIHPVLADCTTLVRQEGDLRPLQPLLFHTLQECTPLSV
jgi:hypothetical protein